MIFLSKSSARDGDNLSACTKAKIIVFVPNKSITLQTGGEWIEYYRLYNAVYMLENFPAARPG
jgi:hypothetical protein